MEKKNKNQSISIIESNINKWFDAETERLVSKGEDINNIFIVAVPYYNKGTIICDDYTLNFNRNECVIDLVINGEEDSSIWGNVISNVPAQFSAVLGKPVNFLYRISSNTSDKKEFYYFESTDYESGELLPISIGKLSLIDAWKAENFGELIS